VLTVAAYLQNVRIALHLVNVLVAEGKNVVAIGVCPITSYNEFNLIP
jgi:hypothetical protein